ncbi:unnamed protein product [Trichogramma brassicae]|uniref:Uncharacterized protein n=1 Tax=Trichogramma brassicae TaxID=86971 RepID=A0A6H5IF92_9HYME|nr:unnamed protein product [Trichogramma brassicae]
MKRATQKRKAITPSPRKRGTNQSLLRVNNNSVAPNTPKNTPKRRRASQDQTPIAPVRIRRSTSEPSTSTGNTEREVRRPNTPPCPHLNAHQTGTTANNTAPHRQPSKHPNHRLERQSGQQPRKWQIRDGHRWISGGRAPKRTDRHKTGDALIRRPRPRGPRRLHKKMRGILYTSPNRRGPKGTNTAASTKRRSQEMVGTIRVLGPTIRRIPETRPCKVE